MWPWASAEARPATSGAVLGRGGAGRQLDRGELCCGGLEITSMTEGYTSPTRPVWTPPASTATLHRQHGRGGAPDDGHGRHHQRDGRGAADQWHPRRHHFRVLISASKYAATRVFQNGDTYDAGYRVSLTV